MLFTESRLFMGRHDGVPNRPHLLIVPNPLVEQWTRELKIFFASKMIEIHTLPTSEAAVEKYLDEEFRSSSVPDILRIVICSHSVSASSLFRCPCALILLTDTGQSGWPIFRHEEKYQIEAA